MDTLLREYAHQIGTDRNSGEFKAWARSIKGLANNFSAALFQSKGNDVLDRIIDGRKKRIGEKRKAMQALSKLGPIRTERLADLA